MQNVKLQFKIQNLRKKYPKFVYKSYSWKILNKNLKISFDFKIEPNIYFKPKIVIENINRSQIKKVGDRVLNNLVFNLGLIEMISYWKASCSPEIIIKAGTLNQEQIKWWEDLIMRGMSQFFYENQINFQKASFLKIKSIKISPTFYAIAQKVDEIYLVKDKSKILVPIGGGKDSIVTLEILKEAGQNINCFSLNPTQATWKIMKIARLPDGGQTGCKKSIIVKRKIDPRLLELNQKGYLNGHTPFSAHLAFSSVLIAMLFDYKYIAFSQERSSNEGNLKYLGKIINHQYSKSFDFEKKFRHYCQKYLTPGVEYFSFLRPLYEIQIAKLFSRFPQYFSVFLSCNEAYKTASGFKKPSKKWCGKCPKCLFIFTSLYPFVDEKNLIKIFGENLFENKNLLPVMLQLIGEEKFKPRSENLTTPPNKIGRGNIAKQVKFLLRGKPFECVGTKKESLVAFYLALRSFMRRRVRRKLPTLLDYFQNKILLKYPKLEKDSIKILNSWNKQHNLPRNFEEILKNHLKGLNLTRLSNKL